MTKRDKPMCRIRRGSDNAERDCLNWDEVRAFIGDTEGFLVYWYDPLNSHGEKASGDD